MGISNQIPNSRLAQAGVCTSTTRPVSPYDGQVIYETDTDAMYVWNGFIWANIVADSPRNLFYNGEMLIAQRSTSVSGITSTGYHTADRWKTEMLNAGTFSQGIVDDAPPTSGFSKALSYQCTTTRTSPAVNTYLQCSQWLEGFDCQSINMGTSSAKSLWLSFWVKSNVTGTYNVEIRLGSDAAFLSRQYTITSGNTWQKVVLEFKPNTSNTITANNNTGLKIQFWLATGSSFTGGSSNNNWGNDSSQRAPSNVNLANAVDNYWRMTGAMLSVGYPAPFEFKSYQDHLRECQRYYWRWNPVNSGASIGVLASWSEGSAYGTIWLPTTMRTAPSSASVSRGNGFVYFKYNVTSPVSTSFGVSVGNSSPNTLEVSGGWSTTIYAGFLRVVSNTDWIDASAEL